MTEYDKHKTSISVHTYNRLLRVLNNWFIHINKHPIYVVYQPNSFIGLKTRIDDLYKRTIDLCELYEELYNEFEVQINEREIAELLIVEQLFQLVEQRLGEKHVND